MIAIETIVYTQMCKQAPDMLQVVVNVEGYTTPQCVVRANNWTLPTDTYDVIMDAHRTGICVWGR